jgi:hypothetical protein
MRAHYGLPALDQAHMGASELAYSCDSMAFAWPILPFHRAFHWHLLFASKQSKFFENEKVSRFQAAIAGCSLIRVVGRA